MPNGSAACTALPSPPPITPAPAEVAPRLPLSGRFHSLPDLRGQFAPASQVRKDRPRSRRVRPAARVSRRQASPRRRQTGDARFPVPLAATGSRLRRFAHSGYGALEKDSFVCGMICPEVLLVCMDYLRPPAGEGGHGQMTPGASVLKLVINPVPPWHGRICILPGRIADRWRADCRYCHCGQW
jgi:hypothetical protein